MKYLYSLDEVCKKITIGYEITHKKFGTGIIKSLPIDDNKKIQIEFDGVVKVFSLTAMYNALIIEFDDDLFKKDNSEIESPRIIEQTNDQQKSFYSWEEKLNDILKNFHDNNTIENSVDNYSNFKKELFKDSRLPNEFFHYTNVFNALKILKTGYIKSRESAQGDIEYDNMVKNDVTNIVMSTNASERVKKYARFYLNPRNKTTYSMKMNFEKNQSGGVIIAINYSSIWQAKTHVFITHKSAHYVETSYLDWNGPNDISKPYNLKNIDTNFSKTFEEYDSTINNDELMAEVLFYDKVPINLISHIYFDWECTRKGFLERLPSELRKLYEDKCVINTYLHWSGKYVTNH